MTTDNAPGWGGFLRLWLVLTFGYAAAKLLFNFAVFHWIDLRPEAFLEIAVVPLAQTLVVWIVTRRVRQRPPS